MVGQTRVCAVYGAKHILDVFAEEHFMTYSCRTHSQSPFSHDHHTVFTESACGIAQMFYHRVARLSNYASRRENDASRACPIAKRLL